MQEVTVPPAATARRVSDNMGRGSSNWGPLRQWRASLSLGFESQGARTRMSTMRFEGPLRVQRPFFPEDGCCHCYILHPPGGMVSGDQLGIDLHVDEGAKVLVTTPSVGKVYGTDSHDLPQRQTTTVKIEHGSLEYLPQETIVFDGARAELISELEVNGASRCWFWDMIVLGRKAGNALFESGSVAQSVRIIRDGIPLVSEHFALELPSSLMSDVAGLQTHTCFGSAYIICPNAAELVASLREVVLDASVTVAVTHKPGVVMIRGFAHGAEPLRLAFTKLWQECRSEAMSLPLHTPRIWST